MTQAASPGKIILFGEHAVVYGRPAIAAPVTQVQARAIVEDSATAGIRFVAPDLGSDYWLAEASAEDPLATTVRLVQEAAGLAQLPDLTITISSSIPIAGGMGSGAAITAALVRALAGHLGLDYLADNRRVSELTYQVERLYHGHPSGIDNTVVAFEQPVYFVRQQPQNRIEPFAVARPLHFLISDTGQRSSTKIVVSDVRRQWQAQPARFEALFDDCGRVADAARQAIQAGDLAQLGCLMNENQRLLAEMGVSSPALERLIAAALRAGALGAKLSGAGRGGNMIALITPKKEQEIRQALADAGAAAVLSSIVGQSDHIPHNAGGGHGHAGRLAGNRQRF